MTVTITKASLLLDSANEAVDRALVRHRTQAVRRHPLLSVLSDAEIDRLVASSEWVSAAAGDVLAAQGSIVDGVLFITEGNVREEIVDSGSGKYRAVVNMLGVGDEVGLVSLVDDAPHGTSAVALGRAQGLKVPVAEVARFLETHPELYGEIARVAVSRFRASSTWLQALI